MTTKALPGYGGLAFLLGCLVACSGAPSLAPDAKTAPTETGRAKGAHSQDPVSPNPAPAIGTTDVKEHPENQSMILLRARIAKVHPHGFHDDYVDGTFTELDVAILKVIAPDQHVGQEIGVVLWNEDDPSSPWRDVGAVYDVKAPENAFDGNVTSFSGSFEILRKIPGTK